MTYKEALEFLYSSLPMFHRVGAAAYKNNLDTTLALDVLHDHPHHSFKTIHIAGTNGKGSVSHLLASVLQEAGYKTGLYTSPHLVDFRERIRINGKMIPESNVVSYLIDNMNVINDLKPSFFEMTVDLAFTYFAKENVDIAIIETGMGGRLDSTNIIQPLVSIITNIGLDHTRFLGDSIGQIANEKAGIIKPETPVIIGEYHEESFPVFKSLSNKKNAQLILADDYIKLGLSLMNPNRTVKHNYSSKSTEYHDLNCDLTGKYQEKNLKTVLSAIEILQEKKIHIPFSSIYSGISKSKQNTGIRGRWEEIAYNPLTICDTAHNEDGVREIVNQIQNTPHKNLHMVWGMVSDKSINSILSILPKNAIYYFTKANIPRALDENELLELAITEGLKGKSYSSVKLAYTEVVKQAQKEDLIFIGGSTFVVGDLLKEVKNFRI